MRTVYIADDGKEFDDKFECEDYEWLLNNPYLKDIKMYDEDGVVLKDIFDEETYDYAMKIVVPTDEAAVALRDLGERNGWCAYADIKASGTWVWECGFNGKFVKVEE